jgi:hypothetical protein
MRYTVPQFIDVEDKIFGPITTRQFVILLVDAGFIFVAYKALDFTAFVIVGLLLFGVGGILAFLRVNGQPFHYFMLNIVQTTKRPGRRVWNKELSDMELRELVHAKPPPPPKPKIIKEPLAATKLSEVSLVVNTGGVFNPEES